MFEASWRDCLASEMRQPYMAQLSAFVDGERRSGAVIYPPRDRVFNALEHTPYDKVKVVVVGQDPYHGTGQAHGLSFSVPKGEPIPPSLRNIYKELQSDLGIAPPTHGCLEDWASRGVLLLNATLTVEEGKPRSHYGRGWERFTDAIVARLGERREPLVFFLWGRSALEKVTHIREVADSKRHLILTAAHPSPLSAYNGFFGCRHFSQANVFLDIQGIGAVDWAIQ